MALTRDQFADFGQDGYVVVPGVVSPDLLARANAEVDRFLGESPPRDGHVGFHFYWPSSKESPALFALMSEGGITGLANDLVTPNAVSVAFDQSQIALNIPVFDHRPGGPHLDGYAADRRVPATFTMLAAVLLTDQLQENSGNLWVWPGTHRTHAAYFREHGPDAFTAAKGYPPIELPEPRQLLGRAGDVLLAHYLLGHNIGGNYESDVTRRAIYWRLRVQGHRERWRECLGDEFLEYPAVRSVLGAAQHGER